MAGVTKEVDGVENDVSNTHIDSPADSSCPSKASAKRTDSPKDISDGTLSKTIDKNQESNLHDTPSEFSNLNNQEDDEFERFRKTAVYKIDHIQKCLDIIAGSFTDMKSDLPESEKMCTRTKNFEAELYHLKRNSPVTFERKAEFDKIVRARSARLRDIRTELVAIQENFKTLRERHDDQCNQIMKTLSAFFALFEKEKLIKN